MSEHTQKNTHSMIPFKNRQNFVICIYRWKYIYFKMQGMILSKVKNISYSWENGGGL